MPQDRHAASARARRFAAESLAGGDPTGWFERLYTAAEQRQAEVPWDSGEANPLLADWFAGRPAAAAGQTALVVGSGLGDDAELVAARGFTTSAFDVSPTAVRTARQRHPDSPVDYRVANLLDPPPEWNGGFDLVVESMTVQALPRAIREPATEKVRGFVAAGGTLLVIAFAEMPDADDADDADDAGPPWPLSRAELEAFGSDSLRLGLAERIPREDGVEFWRARFDAVPRPGGGG
jgi:hypothetical protein